MKIRTEYTGHYDEYAWTAVDDDTYDSSDDSSNCHHVGYGATEAEAIDDLMRLLDELDDAGRDPDCICGWSTVHSASEEPPHRVANKHCPIHGNAAARDPDAEYERRRDDAMDNPPWEE